MPQPATGNTYEKSPGKWLCRVTIATGKRRAFSLPTCHDKPSADARGEVLADVAKRLRVAEVPEKVIVSVIERLASRDGAELAKVKAAAEALCSRRLRAKGTSSTSGPTFGDVAEQWTSGALARDYPDHVKVKRSVSDDVGRFNEHILPHVRNVEIAAFTIDHAEAVMRAIPSQRSSATRRHVAQLLHRVMAMAVFPLRLRADNPLPRGFLPTVSTSKALPHLYPDEDRRLLGAVTVPLCWRVLYGFLDREGLRFSEAAGLNVVELDLDRGAVTLDRNKTDDPRAFALEQDVVRAMRAWLAHRDRSEGKLPRTAPIFVDEQGQPLREDRDNAGRFRAHLRAAGIDREALYEKSDVRRPIRLHDTRATFITAALANGKSEAWVSDRTGHKSSVMINRYRRAARTVAELGLGALAPMDVAIPELAGAAPDPNGSGTGSGTEGSGGASGGRRKGQQSRAVPKVGLEPTGPFGQRILKAGGSPPDVAIGGEPREIVGVRADEAPPIAAAGAASEAGCAASPSPVFAGAAAVLAEAQRAALAGDARAAEQLMAAAAALLTDRDPTPDEEHLEAPEPSDSPPGARVVRLQPRRR